VGIGVELLLTALCPWSVEGRVGEIRTRRLDEDVAFDVGDLLSQPVVLPSVI
jgi:hypothetical protein